MEEEIKNTYATPINIPLTDVNGKTLKVGMRVRKLISEFNFPAGIEEEIITDFDDGVEIWATLRPGITTFINQERASNYEIIEE